MCIHVPFLWRRRWRSRRWSFCIWCCNGAWIVRHLKRVFKVIRIMVSWRFGWRGSRRNSRRRCCCSCGSLCYFRLTERIAIIHLQEFSRIWELARLHGVEDHLFLLGPRRTGQRGLWGRGRLWARGIHLRKVEVLKIRATRIWDVRKLRL